MGYCGLPSKSCSHCRNRRIKCDLSIPSCGQCLRGRRTCFGYRNPRDLLFHDQSEEVACKARRSKRKPQPKSAKPANKVLPPGWDAVNVISQRNSSNYSDAECPKPLTLTLSTERQAFYFFFRNYPSQQSKNFENVYSDISELYFSATSNSPLLCIITALGLAGLSHHTETTGLEIAASVWYDKALRKLNSSLRDPELFKVDQTLLVILLLGLYETNTCSTPRSMQSWLKHIKGALALLDLRGKQQLNSEFGRTLFIQARAHIITGCYQTRSPIPDILVELSRECQTRNANPLEDLNLIIFQFCNLRAKAPFHPLQTQSQSTTRANIARCTSIAQALAGWHDGLPAGFFPKTVSTDWARSDILSGHYEVYEDIWTAGIVNSYRAHSILVHEALITQLRFLQDRYFCDFNEEMELEAQISTSRSKILSLIDAICASVPDLLRSNLAAAGVGLMWALYVPAQISPRTAPIPPMTSSWIIGRLERIGADMGVRQATTLAGLLHKQIEVTELLTDGWAEGYEEDV